jgi:hypothetical protein
VGGSISLSELHLLLEGVDLKVARFKPVHIERVN